VPLNILRRRTPLLRYHRQFLVNVDQVQKLRYVDSGLV
jgi:two-component system LytT family response regulator